MYPSVRVVVDLFELSSMKFMNQRFFDWSLPLTLWPPYASGSVFSGAMFDTMLCQVRHPLEHRMMAIRASGTQLFPRQGPVFPRRDRLWRYPSTCLYS
jgi:hypothetical protein